MHTRVLLAPEIAPAPAKINDADEFLRELLREKRARDDEKSGAYRVILYNDDDHSVDEVTLQIMKATGCDVEKALEIMWEAHTQGRAVCFRGEREKCHRVARVLREIRLQVEVDCD